MEAAFRVTRRLLSFAEVRSDGERESDLIARVTNYLFSKKAY